MRLSGFGGVFLQGVGGFGLTLFTFHENDGLKCLGRGQMILLSVDEFKLFFGEMGGTQVLVFAV